MTNLDQQALGRAIQLRREEIGFSRPELAQLSKLSYPYLYEVERGKKSPSPMAFARLAEALEIDQEELEGRARQASSVADAVAATPAGELPEPSLQGSLPSDAVDQIVARLMSRLEPVVRDAVQTVLSESS